MTREAETYKVKVYKLNVQVIDFDHVGPQGIQDALENARYPNRCISPRVHDIECREVDWHDGHPLNSSKEHGKAFKDLFEAGFLTESLPDAGVEECSPENTAPLRDLNMGHGHVTPRSDGVKVRCGGPTFCRVCMEEKIRKDFVEQ